MDEISRSLLSHYSSYITKTRGKKLEKSLETELQGLDIKLLISKINQDNPNFFKSRAFQDLKTGKGLPTEDKKLFQAVMEQLGVEVQESSESDMDTTTSTVAEVAFLFFARIKLQGLGRKGAGLASWRGRVKAIREDEKLKTLPRVNEIARAYLGDRSGVQEKSNEAFSAEVAALLNEKNPKLEAKVSGNEHFAKLGIIVVKRGVEIPENIPLIIMTEEEHRVRLKFLEEKLNIKEEPDDLEFEPYVKDLVAEMLTWKGGLEYLEKCVKKDTNQLPRMEKKDVWACTDDQKTIYINPTHDLSGVQYRTLSGEPFQGTMHPAITLAHELFHSIDPVMNEDREFADNLMKKVWFNRVELRAIAVANRFRNQLDAGQRCGYERDAPSISLPAQLTNAGGKLISDQNATLPVEELSLIHI